MPALVFCAQGDTGQFKRSTMTDKSYVAETWVHCFVLLGLSCQSWRAIRVELMSLKFCATWRRWSARKDTRVTDSVKSNYASHSQSMIHVRITRLTWSIAAIRSAGLFPTCLLRGYVLTAWFNLFKSPPKSTFVPFIHSFIQAISIAPL